MNRKKNIIIIGAGTIGLHCAYFLKREGHEVRILEALAESDETSCSYVNCGLIVPSHFIPLASPAMLRAGLKMIFDRKAPFSMSSAANLRNIGWFMNFARAARMDRVSRATPVLLRLNLASRKLYADIAEESHPDFGYAQKGLLMAAVGRKAFEEEIAVSKLASDLGIVTRVLDRHQLRQTNPLLNLEGAVWYESDAAIDPLKYLRWLKKWLSSQGVSIICRSNVTQFLYEGKQIKAVCCGKEAFYADEIVIAAGSRSAALGKMLGLKIPVIAGKGYSLDVPVTGNPLQIPLILTEAKVALSPFQERIRLGSGMEFNGKPGQIRTQRVRAMLDSTRAALPFLNIPSFGELPVTEGMRPLSPDGMPLLGRTAAYSNLLFATGHAMMGMSLAPISGKIIADLVCGRKTETNLTLLHPDRFSNIRNPGVQLAPSAPFQT